MIFKKCKLTDLPLIRDLLVDSFSNYFFSVNPSVEELKEKLESLNFDGGNSLIMYIENKPVGIAICGVKGDIVHLGPMGIITKYQGQGYGKELLKRIIELHKENGFKKLILEVICQNKKAYDLYKNTGFKTVRKLRGFRSFTKILNFEPSIRVIQKTPDEALEHFNCFHKDEYLSWQFSYDCIKKSNCNFAFLAYNGEEVAGYSILKDTRIADIGLKKNGPSFEVFKALISAMFSASLFMFIFDLPEEDVKIKYFEEIKFDVFFDQYEMSLGLK